jgi:hypothetical protein
MLSLKDETMFCCEKTIKDETFSNQSPISSQTFNGKF